MADNVTLPGTGAVVATDEVGGAQYQITKIAIGPDGTATILPGDGENGVDVDVTRLPSIRAVNSIYGVVDLDATDMAEGGPFALTVNQRQTYQGVPETNMMKYFDSYLTPKFAVISCSSSGNNTIVAAVASKKIRVLALSITESGAVNAKFQSAAGGTDKTGLYYLAEKGGLVLPFNQLGWFETVAGELLNLNLSAAVPVGGCLTYIEV
jgi:hypothetical protein